MSLTAPTASATAFGFEVPQGDPGEIEAAAQSCSTWSGALTSRAAEIRAGAATACSGWTGSAESGFANFAAHVVQVYESLGQAVGSAGRALSAFGRELEMAQRVTTQALQECETESQAASTASQAAVTHGQEAQTLGAQASAAAHPQVAAELGRQANVAQAQQDAAARAADRAQTQLQAAERRGQQAWTDYQRQAQDTARTLASLESQIQRVERMPAGAGGGGGAGTSAGGAGFWPVFNGVAGSDITAGTLGLGENILKRYRNSDLLLPITKQASQSFEDLAGHFSSADPWVQLPSGLFVESGGSVDPFMSRVDSVLGGDGVNTPGKPFLTVGTEDLAASAPTWARVAGRGFFVAGAGLTLYSAGADEWNYDSVHHPGWSTAAKVADTAQTTVVVGGSSVGGALAGAEIGGETGAAIGATIGSAVPILGTAAGGVVGGVVGGVGGAIVGSKVGQTIGHGLEDGGHWVAHEAGDLWNSVFG